MSNKDIEFGSFGVTVWEEITDMFRESNWYDVHLAKLYVEKDSFMGLIRFEVALLGFGLDLRYHYTDTEAKTDMLKKIEELNRKEDRE